MDYKRLGDYSQRQKVMLCCSENMRWRQSQRKDIRMTVDVCVMGAGIVGITAALELQDRGLDVLLIDRDEPGKQTSFGNAGVLSVSTVLTVNNPNLLKNLPRMLLGRAPYFRYDLAHSITHLSWLAQFLRFSASSYSLPTARTLLSLQTLSIARHRELLAEAGAEAMLRETGWIKAYRSVAAGNGSALECKLMDQLGVKYVRLSGDDLRAMEPGLNPIYESAILLSETCSVSDPYALSSIYLKLFMDRGGRFRTFDVTSIKNIRANKWRISSQSNDSIECEQAVIACGPWSSHICAMIDYNVPMAWERGYNLNVESPQVELGRPVLDVECGFVMTPQGSSTRISSGVEFAHRDAPPDYSQVRRAYDDAKAAAAFGPPVDETPWLGSRPTLPDSLPMIGCASKHSNLWFNFGHQHIGLGTSTGSAVILADLMLGEDKANISKAAYSPGRFGA